jgi:predicted ribosome quality control (RQC) complex YloA/Tae2 family protein
MYVDAMTLATVADEWGVLLAGGRIDTIILPTEYALALQCYVPGSLGRGGQNRWLYLSAHPQLARAHLTALKPPKIASEPPAFVMLLRKHLEGTRIETVVQPRWERVLEIIAGYRSGPEGNERVRFRLIIEIMGRLSNIILCNEAGLILGSLKRIGSDINRYRVIAAGVQYVPPPPQQRFVADQTLPRLEPTSVTSALLALSAAGEHTANEKHSPTGRGKKGQEPTKLWQFINRQLQGFSPLLAREVVYRTTEESETPLADVNAEMWEELAWNIRDLTAAYDTHHWQPQLVERLAEGESVEQAVPIAFAPYVLEQYARQPGRRVRRSSSINVLLDDYYARAEWRDAMEGVRSPMRRVLQTHLERRKRRAELLQQEMATSEEAARYRLQGDLLLAHQHEVQQGESSVTLQNFFTDDAQGNTMVTVALDPRFDAVGNANRMFNKYHKLRRALQLIPAQIEQNNVELATVEQLLSDLQLAETPTEVALVKAEIQSAGYIRGKQAQDKKALKAAKKGKGGKQAKGKPVPPGGGVPLQVQSSDSFTMLVGKNSRQNEEVTFHQAAPNDIWLHARGVPGAHVIIKAAGRDIPHCTIEQAASLAAYYSQARGSTSAPVDYTQQRYVKHMKGGGPGMVIYERERTLHAEPDAALPLLTH